MSLNVPLTVRIRTNRVDRHITQDIRDLSFRVAIPGGFASATFSLSRPIDITPDDIAYFARVYVYDARTGKVVWEGRLEDPGRGVSDAPVYSITATGPSAYTRDETFPIIYVDQSLDRWVRSRYSTHHAQTEKQEVPSALSGISDGQEEYVGLNVQASQGVTIGTDWQGDFIYRAMYFCGQHVARLRCEYVAEGASSNYKASMFFRAGYSASDFNQTHDWVTSPATIAENLGSGITVSDSVASLRATRNNSGTTADALCSVYFYNVKIRSTIFNPDGTENFSTSGYNVNNIDPVEVVGDLLGRKLHQFDGAGAYLVGSGVDIYQLAYPDGVTAADILDDIAVFDPGYYWAAWESNPQTDKYRFEYRPWPTNFIRYEATTDDGFDSPGSATELYNSVHVRWRDGLNRVRATIRTQSVPVLTAAGLTRQAHIDVADEMGDATNAIYIGDNFLGEHKYPPNAGTLRVARPILDNLTGRMVMPWEIRPGHLIRVRGVNPRQDLLNPTTRDGVTVFQLLSMEYNASDNSANVELDSISRTVATALAKAENTRFRKL